MKNLYLRIDGNKYLKKVGETYSPYGFSSSNYKDLLDCLKLESLNVVDPTIFDGLNTSSQSLVAGDKVFIMPGVTIPRYKIRETGKEIGFDIVRNQTKATKVVFNKKQVIEEMIDKRNEMGIPINSVKQMFETYNVSAPELDDPDTGSYVVVDWSLLRGLNHVYNSVISGNTDGLETNHFYTYRFKEDAYEQLINDLLANTKVIISDKDVMKQCNGSQPLNSESYTRLVSMFSSNQNQEIALELLCNCDYDQSMVYILKLISRFNLRNMPGTNHVNYKAFRQYMTIHWDIDPNYYSGDIIDIVRRLADGGKLKREYLSEFKEDILKHVKTYGENNIFAISAIQMNETYKEKIVE